MINIEDVSNNFIRSFESFLGINFPTSYRNFLLLVHKNIYEQNVFYINNEEYELRYFFKFVPQYERGILERIKMYKNRIPNNMIPIASDDCGNLILISISGDDYGKIYYWDHEREANDGEEPDYSNLTLVADSFDKFIAHLKSEDDLDD